MTSTPIYDGIVQETGFDPQWVSEPWTLETCEQRAQAHAQFKEESEKKRAARKRQPKKKESGK